MKALAPWAIGLMAACGLVSLAGVASANDGSGLNETPASLTISTPAHGGAEAPPAAPPGAAPAQPRSPSGLSIPVSMPIADEVIVRKSQRRLYLMRDGKVLRSYRISLGLEPQGPKERAGDFRTPEGHYFLTRRNPRSDYFLSILVSYPGPEDRARAQRRHIDPGGEIMLHGLPNILRHKPAFYEHSDWTDGCIALSDSDMVEVWLMTRENTPIEILP